MNHCEICKKQVERTQITWKTLSKENRTKFKFEQQKISSKSLDIHSVCSSCYYDLLIPEAAKHEYVDAYDPLIFETVLNSFDKGKKLSSKEQETYFQVGTFVTHIEDKVGIYKVIQDPTNPRNHLTRVSKANSKCMFPMGYLPSENAEVFFVRKNLTKWIPKVGDWAYNETVNLPPIQISPQTIFVERQCWIPVWDENEWIKREVATVPKENPEPKFGEEGHSFGGSATLCHEKKCETCDHLRANPTHIVRRYNFDPKKGNYDKEVCSCGATFIRDDKTGRYISSSAAPTKEEIEQYVCKACGKSNNVGSLCPPNLLLDCVNRILMNRKAGNVPLDLYVAQRRIEESFYPKGISQDKRYSTDNNSFVHRLTIDITESSKECMNKTIETIEKIQNRIRAKKFGQKLVLTGDLLKK